MTDKTEAPTPLPPLPEKRWAGFCGKCNSVTKFQERPNTKAAPCGRCGYATFCEELDYSDDEMRDYARAALAQRQQVPEGWRPIQTAPRNGTNILLRFGVDGVSQGKYVVGGFHHPWRFIDTNDGITWMVNYAVEGPGGPSHWMHMPSAHLAPSLTAAPQAAEPDDEPRFTAGGGFPGDHNGEKAAQAQPQEPPRSAPLTFTSAQRRRLWDNSPEIHKDAKSFAAFERIVQLTERAHGISTPEEQR